MSGICAIRGREEGLASALETMCGGMSLRGSDRIERLTDREAGVGVTARYDSQQFFADSRVLVACDADLMNEDELHRIAPAEKAVPAKMELAHLFAILYQRFGAAFLEKLEGSFSFVLWDRIERKLVAGIDGFGINRLAYYHDDKITLIATRVDALARHREIDLAINPLAVANVLNFSANLAPATILAKVRRMEPGTVLIASERKFEIRKYWKLKYGVRDGSSEEQLSRALESTFESSVARHCKDDSFNQIGAFLSGGTDSSTVVGMMSRTGRGPVKSFSIGFQEQEFNELEYAQITADWFKTDHHTYLVGADDCFDALPEMIRSFDEPYGNSSAICTYFCARLAAQNGVNTLLAGDGGDELFGGNTRYQTDKVFEIYQKFPWLLRKGLVEPLLAMTPGVGPFGKAKRYIRRSNIPQLDRFFSYNFLCAHDPAQIFNGDFLSSLNGSSLLETPRAHFESADARDGLDRLLYLDMNITLGDNDLPKVTRMCEMAGIKVRFPFLDRAVAEMSGRIPASLKVKGFEKRYLFKQAFRNLLPPAVLTKKKHGFGLPVALWLKSDRRMSQLAQDTLQSRRAVERGYFRREYIEHLFQANRTEETPYYGDMLWIFLTLELWHQQVVDHAAKVVA